VTDYFARDGISIYTLLLAGLFFDVTVWWLPAAYAVLKGLYYRVTSQNTFPGQITIFSSGFTFE
jgi:hypothetical protein